MKILVFPRATNPYQEMLYRQMRTYPDFHYRYIAFAITQNTVLNCLLFPLLLIHKRIQKYSLIHIHWLYEFRGHRSGLLTRLFFTIYVLWILILIKLIGYRLVYTMHDIMTHDNQFFFEKVVTTVILRLSDHVICLSDLTVQKLESMHISVPRRKISIIPHGSYTGWYNNSIGTRKAKRLLHVPEAPFVLLFFGIIRPYKGVADLLSALKTVIRRHSIVCVIAGVCYDDRIKKEIFEFSRLFPAQTRLFLDHILDDDVQTYFNACDCVVFPFRHVTNSGSVLLAASFKKPFIAPATGSIRDFPNDTGIFYDPTDVEGLLMSIETAIRMKRVLSKYGLKGYRYVNRTRWSLIAANTMNIYRSQNSRE